MHDTLIVNICHLIDFCVIDNSILYSNEIYMVCSCLLNLFYSGCYFFLKKGLIVYVSTIP